MTIRPRPNEEYELKPGYFSAWRLLDKMVDDGELLCFKAESSSGRRDVSLPDLYVLRGTKKPAKQSWEHILDLLDVYVCYVKTRKTIGWKYRWDISEYREFAGKHGINFDLWMELDSVKPFILWEIDRCSENYSEIETKTEKYAGLADSMPKHPFWVAFTIVAARTRNIKLRADNFKAIFKAKGRGHNFLVGPQELILADPYGSVFDDYRHHNPVSLLALPDGR